MKSIQEWLAGKKTYIVCIGAIVAAVSAFAGGELDTAGMVEAIFAAIMAATLRAGIGKGEVKKALIPLIGLAVLMGGCSMSAGERYILRSETYTARMTALTALRADGYLTTADQEEITTLSDRADALLDQVERDVLDGGGVATTYLLIEVDDILDQLLRMQIAAEAVKKRAQEKSE